MSTAARKAGWRTHRVSLTAIGAGLLLVVLVVTLLRTEASSGASRTRLILYCAAGMRLPIEPIRADFERECGVRVDVQYGGSNTLLSQLQVSRTADLYLAADDAYLAIARDKGLVQETLPLAYIVPVIVVPRGNPDAVVGIDDLLQKRLRVALGNPDQAAIGQRTRQALRAAGRWDALEQHVTASGVFMPTVADIANAVKIGSVDAGVVWSATAAQYDDLEAIAAPELSTDESRIAIGVTRWSRPPHAALSFARYAAGRNRGLIAFGDTGYDPVEGDRWSPHPQLTVSVHPSQRHALEPAIRSFENREGVRVDIVEANLSAVEAGQTFSIARDPEHKQTARRLLGAILGARPDFEAADSGWLEESDHTQDFEGGL